MSQKHSAHTTLDEIRFIDGIGKFSNGGEKAGVKATLTGYVEAIKKRAEWEGLDYDKVIAHAKTKLAGM